ncbi:hypothetical protein ACIBQ6_13300 [Nonomuraea sp. NPDC049655]|uniref:hypothetical protein n=1 Tax=Nonomuraea sp. NPDC049655 TaxID=3364355 RepID=UPI003791B5D1
MTSGVWRGTCGAAHCEEDTFDQEGQFLSGSKGIDGVNAWWAMVPDPVRRQIELGRKPVFIYGDASRTSTSERNAVIAAQRLEDVRRKPVMLAGRQCSRGREHWLGPGRAQRPHRARSPQRSRRPTERCPSVSCSIWGSPPTIVRIGIEWTELWREADRLVARKGS